MLPGASWAAEGYKGLREALGCHEGTPMVPRVTDFTDFCLSSQQLLIDTNNELKKKKNELRIVQGSIIYSTKR